MLRRIGRQVPAIIAIGTSLYHIYTGFFGTPDLFFFRILHLLLMVALTLLYFPFRGQSNNPRLIAFLDYGLLGLWCASMAYLFIFYTPITNRMYYIEPLTVWQFIFGVSAILLVLEANRRTTGLCLPIVALCFILYALTGPHLPGILHHTGKTVEYILDNQYLQTEGIFGIPTGISATYIILFIIFGAFLNHSGFGEFVIKLATAVAGWSRGGPAKIAVLASGLVGMVQGYSTANVVTTGVFTIPMMKRMGFKSHFAAAVEAAASTGGNIMPPVMSAAAFLMAEFTAIPYVTIIGYALLPATLYFLSVGIMVHLYSVEHKIEPIPRSELPDIRKTLKEQGHLGIPLVLLVYLLIRGFSPMLAVTYSILGIVIVSNLRRGTRMGLKAILRALEDGAKTATMVATACATSGIIVSVVIITGLGQRFTENMLAIAGGNIYLVLGLAALSSLVLGTGVPLIPAYIIQVGMIIPALVEAGISPAQAHLFVIFFCAISLITPPMAVTSFAAAGIANAPIMKTSFEAVKLATASYIIPFVFALSPALMLIGDPLDVVLASFTSIIGVISLASAIQGFMFMRLNPLVRVVLFFCSVLLIEPGLWSDGLGFVLFMGIVLINKYHGSKLNAMV